MTQKLQPLTWDIPIVDSQGRPTSEFMRKWAQQTGVNDTIPTLSTAAQVSAVLDKIASAVGSIFVRGASAWAGVASSSDAKKFLNGAATPAFAQVKDSDLSTSDVTTNDVSITKHGFVPKAPNDATKYLNGVGAYAVPAGGGGGGGGVDLIVLPTVADFSTIVNGRTASPAPSIVATDASLVTFDSAVCSSSGDTIRAALKAIATPASPWTCAAGMRLSVVKTSYRGAGLCLSDGTKYILYMLQYGTGSWPALVISRHANDTSYSGTSYTRDSQAPRYFRVNYDGSNLNFSFSEDGRNWVPLYTESATAYLSTAPTHYGFGGNANQNGTPPSGDHFYIGIHYWSETAP